MVIRGVVFDLDDTLYDERDYVRSGFAAVGRSAARDSTEGVADASTTGIFAIEPRTTAMSRAW